MKTSIQYTLAAVAIAAALPAAAEITFYGREGFEGGSFTTVERVGNLERLGFNDRASSAIVRGGLYEVCTDSRFEGLCVVLRPGQYPSLASMGVGDAISSVRPIDRNARIEERRFAPPPPVVAAPLPVVADITFYGREGFEGRSFTTAERVGNLERQGFNDRASSAIVRGGRFEVCTDSRFEGRCVVLRPGQYPSLAAMGVGDAISSVRPVGRGARVEEQRFAPPPPVAYDYRRRRDERLFEADVVAVRAVYGRPEQRCWVERERVAGSDANIGSAIAGAVIGGILGHQVGSGRGNDAATAAGVIAGAAIGSNFGSNGPSTTFTQDVRRCDQVQGGPPQYWDVTYRFRGQDRYLMMTRPPGRTVTVNADGEPRA